MYVITVSRKWAHFIPYNHENTVTVWADGTEECIEDEILWKKYWRKAGGGIRKRLHECPQGPEDLWFPDFAGGAGNYHYKLCAPCYEESTKGEFPYMWAYESITEQMDNIENYTVVRSFPKIVELICFYGWRQTSSEVYFIDFLIYDEKGGLIDTMEINPILIIGRFRKHLRKITALPSCVDIRIVMGDTQATLHEDMDKKPMFVWAPDNRDPTTVNPFRPAQEYAARNPRADRSRTPIRAAAASRSGSVTDSAEEVTSQKSP